MKPSGSFNLVIERLLISGQVVFLDKSSAPHVSISLSSGFSFQGARRWLPASRSIACFNLVIERLLISGHVASAGDATELPFQSRYRAASHFRFKRALFRAAMLSLFQSRYRAASHFRRFGRDRDSHHHLVSISLSSGFSFQDRRWRREV